MLHSYIDSKSLWDVFKKLILEIFMEEKVVNLDSDSEEGSNVLHIKQMSKIKVLIKYNRKITLSTQRLSSIFL